MKTTKLMLSAGVLVLGPMLAATLRDHKDRLAAANQGQLTDPFEMLDLTCTVAHAAAQRVDPTITRAHIDNLVDTENVAEVYAACWGASLPPPTGEVSPGASPAS